MTIARPMFPPVDRTRRRLLSVAAAGGVALAVAASPSAGAANAPLRLAASPDPVLALIEAHRDALADCVAAALALKGRDDEIRDAIVAQITDAEGEAFCDLCECVPETMAGTRAWVSHMAALAQSDGVWRFEDVGAVIGFMVNLDAALTEQGGQA